jgi:hypothetical protein
MKSEINSRIKKAKSIMGAMRHIFDNNNVSRRVKAQISIAGPLNTPLWGCKCWNVTKRNLHKLQIFHHGAIRRILSIKWQDMRDKHIENVKLRALLCNIPNVDTFINRRTASNIGKIA